MATIKGKWVFNGIPQKTTLSQSFSIDDGLTIGSYENCLFTSPHFGDRQFYRIGFRVSSLYNGERFNDSFSYFDSQTQISTWSAYNYLTSSWVGDDAKIVDFGTTEQTVTDTFLSWMQANATPEAAPVPTNAVTIEYNGSVIASLKAGQSATLECKDLPMLDNVVITVPEMGGADVPEWDGSYTVSGGTISFTIDGTSYEAEDGMTWAEWCSSKYNTGGWINTGTAIEHHGSIPAYLGAKPTETIIPDKNYEQHHGGGSND